MGFIYDTDYYKNLGSGGVNEGIFSNNNEEGYNDSSKTNPTFQGGNFVWNLFPVPTHTLEGHATVYLSLIHIWVPIAAPSANRSQTLSPTTAQAVYERLGDGIAMILEGDSCTVGVE